MHQTHTGRVLLSASLNEHSLKTAAFARVDWRVFDGCAKTPAYPTHKGTIFLVCTFRAFPSPHTRMNLTRGCEFKKRERSPIPLRVAVSWPSRSPSTGYCTVSHAKLFSQPKLHHTTPHTSDVLSSNFCSVDGGGLGPQTKDTDPNVLHG
jgi:hypothetical protein